MIPVSRLFRRRSVLERALAKPRAYDTLSYLLDKVVWKAVKQADDFEKIPYPQQVVFLVWWCSAEISNGGTVQWLWNSTGDHYHEVLAVLEMVGANEIRDAFEAARVEVFGDRMVPRDWRERRSLMVDYFRTEPFNFDDNEERLATMRDSPACVRATSVFYEHELRLVDGVRSWLAANWEN